MSKSITEKPYGTNHTESRTHSYSDANFTWPGDGGLVPHSHISSVELHERSGFANDVMADLVFKLTVNQLTTSIRLHGVDDEANGMLSMLESLVIEGEIAFTDFMRRVNNLFPETMDRIDPALIAKLSAYAAD